MDEYTFRPATHDDVEALVAVLNAAAMEMTGEPDFSVEELAHDFRTPELDLAADTLLAVAPGGDIAAYQDVWPVSSVPVHPLVWGRVHPDHRGRGLGTHLLRWGLERARASFERVPADARVAARAFSPEGFAPGRELLVNEGFTLFRHSLTMVIDLDDEPPAPVWPTGIGVRTYRHPEDAEATCRTEIEAFRDHYGSVEEPFDKAFAAFQHMKLDDTGFDPAFWFLAVDGDRIAGVSLCRREDWQDRESGWVASLGVLPEYRRRGIALALLLRSFGALRAAGQKRAALSVDASNLTGAVRLYEKAGMRVRRRHDRYEKVLRDGREISVT